MTIMLLDDDPVVIEGLKSRIDWNRLGIDTVLTANNAAQARAQWKSGEIDILLSDIEMPAESGLSFTEWLRDSGDDVQVAYLTSYANFSYAQKAISLGSQRYFLKPIDYKKLENELVSMANLAAAVKEKRQTEERARYWRQNSQMVAEHFWSRLLTQGDGAFEPDVFSAIEAMGLNYNGTTRFLPLCVLPSPSLQTKTAGGRQVLFRELAGLVKENIENDDLRFETAVMLTESMWVFLLRIDNDSYSALWVERGLRRLTDKLERTNGQSIRAGIGLPAGVVTANGITERMREAMAQNETELVKLQDTRSPQITQRIMPEGSWNELLFRGEYTEPIESLCGLAARAASAPLLGELREEVTARVYAVLTDYGMEVCYLFSDEESESLYRAAVDSAEKLTGYARHLMEKTVEYLSNASNPRTMAKRLAHFLDENYDRVITRNSLAEMVYLNPDYMARLFKREMGVSVNTYLTDRRMEAAKDLIENTSMPVSAVSMKVGYGNFAYFSKMFRERTGLTPNEFRKKSRSDIK